MRYTPEYLLEHKNNYPNEPALSYKKNGAWSTLTWKEYYDYVIKIAKSLISLNLSIGDKGAIYSYNRIEWFGCYSARSIN